MSEPKECCNEPRGFVGGVCDHCGGTVQSLLHTVIGDASLPHIEPDDQRPVIIPHICNDVGAWGAGFTGALSKLDQRPEMIYRHWFSTRWTITPFRLGYIKFAPYCRAPHDVSQQIVVVCHMLAQEGIGLDSLDRPPIRYHFLLECLRRLADVAVPFGATIHMPKIGAGLAGGDWNRIEGMIRDILVDRGIPVTVYVLPQEERY